MSEILNIYTIEELHQFLNEKGILEIAMRGKQGRFKTFQKIALNNLPQNETKRKVLDAIALLNQNNQINQQNLRMIGNVEKLDKLNLVLGGINLCATCVGFAIMDAELRKISTQIEKVVEIIKKTEGIQANFEYKKILSEYSNMLDCRKKHNYYSEEQMRILVSREYDVLDMLLNYFERNTSSNREELIFSILSLASMLAISLKYFDEIYYFNNKKAIGDGYVWHSDHEKWLSTYDRMTESSFVKKIQDYGFFEKELNTIENDCFYISFYDQIKSLKQEVEDNQNIIQAIDDSKILTFVKECTNRSLKEEIKRAFDTVGISPKLYENSLHTVVA